ncbi:LysR family transcriptional regulator [Bradyrhizobium sp. DOA9]|uniref:LysR family transcriptional regulator n=1 Tax=Bradyrhizobium sp. DOA9 TaxID=1126627 RepID=UPI0004693BF5|nr:LysR family transcriptional regulator [Bradyrhizobium sp. DOA9]GAJ36185.1 HTH-type transcriptional regulator dgdR [Bradyrhizobium sp. DOA9]
MDQRKGYVNIPTEIVRTAIAISETGSLSKAGEMLGLSQPAISSQMKRLQNLVGGPLFERTSTGTVLSDLGRLALQQARRMIEANDQLLRLSGNTDRAQPVRLGLNSLFATDFFKAQQSAGGVSGIFVQVDQSGILAKALIEGYLDIACIFDHQRMDGDIRQMIVAGIEEPLVWVRAKQFVVSPGSPIPILTWPGHDWMVRTLERHEISYKIVFNSPDFEIKLRAVEAGMGFTAVPASKVPDTVVIAKDYYLPELPSIRRVMCVRASPGNARMAELTKQLATLFFEPR